MIIKGVKPQTHLQIDLTLFALLVIVAFTGLMQQILPGERTHTYLMFHVLHQLAGVAMCLVVTLHLFIHIPWIHSQLPRLFASRT